jgi:hypothetical protein
MSATTARRSPSSESREKVVESNIPARLDRLPWSGWHRQVVFGLGAVWILDGLEVNFLGLISSRLSEKGSGLALTASQGITAGAVYVAGACFGALVFGYLTERFGRKRLFMSDTQASWSLARSTRAGRPRTRVSAPRWRRSSGRSRRAVPRPARSSAGAPRAGNGGRGASTARCARRSPRAACGVRDAGATSPCSERRARACSPRGNPRRARAGTRPGWRSERPRSERPGRSPSP